MFHQKIEKTSSKVFFCKTCHIGKINIYVVNKSDHFWFMTDIGNFKKNVYFYETFTKLAFLVESAQLPTKIKGFFSSSSIVSC